MVSEAYLQLAREKAGGINEAALDSLVYWNNPFALKHWTMNVIELLMITGAAMALVHAWRESRRGDPSGLCLWFACVVYLLVTEVPLYFPQLLGLDIGLVFMHNEFTAGILYNQTPLYIVALYPALIYPSYLLVRESGMFERRGGLWLGAVCVGFVHHCFYEIFDHYGPQFAWWIWNYDNPMVSLRLASVPFTSIVVFSLTPPMVAALLARLVLRRYVARCEKRSVTPAAPVLVLLTLVVGVLIPLINAFLPTSMISGLGLSESLATGLYLSAVAAAGFVALWAAARWGLSGPMALRQYPVSFLTGFLVVMAALWAYALPEYLRAAGGESGRGTPLGSLPYVAGCFVAAVYLLYRLAGRRPALG